MQAEGYREHSHGQYDVHTFSRDMLLASVKRVVSSSSSPILRVVDMGAADGTNSMNTLRFLADHIPEKPMHVTFEEHPDTDEKVLRNVLESHKAWFQERKIDYDILMKSFYEPLFERDSVDLVLSYICLHWLDTADAEDGGIASWKRFHDNSKTNFIFAQENGVPESITQQWKQHLALPHLAKFLTLRAHELRVGGEMMLAMVGEPFEWCVLPESSLFTKAIQQCIDKGTVRPSVLEKAVIPYYLRSLEDIESAVSLSNQQLSDGMQLELLSTRKISLKLGKQGDLDSAFSMLWSIHQGAIRAGGATDAEMTAIRKESEKVNKEFMDVSTGIEGTYLACVVRRSS
jgi:hypothetical protein